ncbi:PLP-dependent lyase/thiolase [Patescibacteria group bacterium]|nr:PLP-dependent lyase/thiolase [Patescibacteria group bacterium]
MTPTALQKIDQIYFKREDQNLTGSAKDRAIEKQVKNALLHHFTSAVISSTGNAAISAVHFCRQYHLPLTIFLSPQTDPAKLLLLRQSKQNIVISLKPISDAFKYTQKNHSYNLRQSTDPVALKGYSQIGLEIKKQLPKISSIFIPIASGTTLLGLSQTLPSTCKIFAVQPASYCPLASVFDKNYRPETTTSTTSLSVRSLPLKTLVLAAIKKSHGSTLVVQEENVKRQQKHLEKNKIYTSAEGALALAGYQKAQKIFDPGPFPLILLTGAKR